MSTVSTPISLIETDFAAPSLSPIGFFASIEEAEAWTPLATPSHSTSTSMESLASAPSSSPAPVESCPDVIAFINSFPPLADSVPEVLEVAKWIDEKEKMAAGYAYVSARCFRCTQQLDALTILIAKGEEHIRRACLLGLPHPARWEVRHLRWEFLEQFFNVATTCASTHRPHLLT